MRLFRVVADVSRKEDVDYHALEGLVDKYIEEEVDFNTIDDIGVLGFDDISLNKGYRNFVTIVIYRWNDEVRLLAVLDGRERATVEAFLRSKDAKSLAFSKNTLAASSSLF